MERVPVGRAPAQRDAVNLSRRGSWLALPVHDSFVRQTTLFLDS